MKHILYECDVCGGYHPWDFHSADCDSQRFESLEEYAEQKLVTPTEIQVRTMEEHEAAETEDEEFEEEDEDTEDEDNADFD